MEKLTIKRLAEIQVMELEPGAQEIVAELAAEVVRLRQEIKVMAWWGDRAGQSLTVVNRRCVNALDGINAR